MIFFDFCNEKLTHFGRRWSIIDFRVNYLALTDFLYFLGNNNFRDENAYLRGRIDELTRQLDNANEELRDLCHDVGQLQSFNKVIGQENEDLRKMLRSRSAPQQDIESNVDVESEEEARLSKWQKKEKGKKPVRHSEDEMEVDDDGARVRPIASFPLSTYFS